MHLSCASKLSRMSVLVSGLQKPVLIAVLILCCCRLATAQVRLPDSAGQGRSPADADDQTQPLSRVTVTGYIVPRIGEGPEPVTTLDQDFITKQGDQTVADVLLRLPQNFGGFTPALNAGQSTPEGGSAGKFFWFRCKDPPGVVDGRPGTTLSYAPFCG